MDVSFLGLFVLLSVASCSAEKGVRSAMKAAGSKSVTLEPWLVGLSAVVGFLFIVFTILIVRRLLKKKRDDADGWEYNKTLELEGVDAKQTSL